MSFQHPTILYIGDPEDAKILLHTANARDWHVYVPEDVLTALGMYITYWPDVVVIDTTADPVVVGETYLHLRSVSDPAGRQTPIVLLGAEQQWDSDPSVAHLPAGLRYDDLLDRLFDLLRHAHYTLSSAVIAAAG